MQPPLKQSSPVRAMKPARDPRQGYDVIACQACGFRHIVPLPEPAALESAYRETYYADEKPTFLAHAARIRPGPSFHRMTGWM